MKYLLIHVKKSKTKTGKARLKLHVKLLPTVLLSEKSITCYHKVAEKLLFGTTVVNAWLTYKECVDANAQNRRKTCLFHQYS